MDIIQCDGCSKQSPDEGGLHVANKWTKVSLPGFCQCLYAADPVYIFCDECLPNAQIKRSVANTLRKYVKKLFD